MKGIYNVEQVLAECGVLASFSVIQKHKWNHRYHCPFVVEAQVGIKLAGLGCEIIGEFMYQYENAPSAYSQVLQILFFTEKPYYKGNGHQVYSALKRKAHKRG